jgi:Zn-dependent metalloprotease
VMTGGNDAGATRTFHVALRGGSDRPGSREVFVDARDGSIVYSIDSMPAASGIAWTLYSGRVTIETTEVEPHRYQLINPNCGDSQVWDMDGATEGSGTAFVDEDDNVWGNGSITSRQTVAGDAHFGVGASWAYFRDVFGRNGADGAGTGITCFVHYGEAVNNAFGGNNQITIGNGDASTRTAFASPDVVGHEFTHNVVQYSAGLGYTHETGAINESMSDIFGTAIELEATGDDDFLMGEQIVVPPGSALRDLANPKVNHYSKLKRLKINELPDRDANDNGWVHANAGILNNVYYLLSVGGRNSASDMLVPAIGRRAAEEIFYVALTRYMYAGSDYFRTANATLSAATDLYGFDSPVYRAVKTAWYAVGVLSDQPPAQDNSEWGILSYAYSDGSASTSRIERSLEVGTLVNYPAGSFSNEWSSIVGDSSELFYYNRDTGLAALGSVDLGGNHSTDKVWQPGFFGTGWTHIVRHKGSLFFYNQSTGVGCIGRLTGPNGFTQYSSYSGFSFWTHIVSVQGRLLFYNMNNGVSAMCDIIEEWDTTTPFRTLKNLHLQQYSTFGLSRQWSDIVDSRNGIVFYNQTDGRYCVGDVNSSNGITTRVPGTSPAGRPLWKYTNLATGYSHVVCAKGVLLFYNVNTGESMTATMRTTDPMWASNGEPLVFGLMQYLPSGWTHLTSFVMKTSLF